MSHVVLLLTRGQSILIFYEKSEKQQKMDFQSEFVKINRIFNFDHQSLIYFPLNYTNIQCLCPSMHFGLLSSNNNLLISLHPHFRTSRGLFRKLSPRNKFRIFIFIIYMATQLTKYTPKLD